MYREPDGHTRFVQEHGFPTNILGQTRIGYWDVLDFQNIMEANMWHTLRKICNLPANGSKFKDIQIFKTADVEDPDLP